MTDLSHEIELSPAFHDLDPMDIVWHGNYVKYLEIARNALMAKFDYDYLQMRASGYAWPIVDLRMKLNIAKVEYTEFTVVIILNVKGTVVGAVVDGVSDVVTLDANTIKPAPQFESSIESRFIVGLANLGERMLIVMNIETLMSNSELGMITIRDTRRS